MMRANHLLIIGAVAAAGYIYGPQIRDHVLPLVGSTRTLNMNLDPNAVSPNVEDRRGERGEDMGPGPSWGRAGGSGPGGRGGGMRCWDKVEHRDVPMEFCDREQGGRR